MLPSTVERRVKNLIIFAGPGTTLAISPWFNFDPINLIKVLVLTCSSFAALGLLIPYLPLVINKVGKSNFLILFFFITALFSPFFFSGASKSQQFWGVFGRNTGILSYLALLAILFVTASVASRETYARLTWSLIVTVFIMSAYCLIQIANLDPISWSAFFPFGTLGNVNFLSGFMGLSLVTVFIFTASNFLQKRMRINLSILFVIGIYVLISSDSTQGIVALVVGISTYLLIRSWYVHRALFLFSSLVFSFGIASLVLGLMDKGPLRGLIYQFTVLFRADYMHAGIEMVLKNPLTGVGIDSYDDWYRAERGIISALRTSLNRTANSAHNIMIDLAAGGGLPLLMAYLLLLALISFAIITGLRKGFAQDPIFMAIAMSWIAYQVQASVSINQIGVGVWGWILGGALLGYSKLGKIETSDGVRAKMPRKSKLNSKPRSSSPNTPPPLSVISSSAFLVLGFTLAFLPLKTDADFAKASKVGSAQLLLDITDRSTTNTFMLQKTAVDTYRSNLPDIAKTINERLKSRFPRNVGGWFVTLENSTYTQEERTEALKVISELDPIVYLCYLPDPTNELLMRLEELPAIEKYRLALGWGLTVALSDDLAKKYSFAMAANDELLVKIRSFCGY